MGPDLARGSKALVFCNTVDSSRAVEHYCREQRMPTVCYNGEMSVSARQEAMEAFAAGARGALRVRMRVCDACAPCTFVRVRLLVCLCACARVALWPCV